jgi:LysR family glycine cleavage system transcriptional activator
MPSVASSWLLPRLAGFVAAHPEIDLSVQSTVDLVDFDRSAVDAALRFGLGSWPGLRTDPGDRWREWFARFGGAPPGRYVASFSDVETLQRAAVEGMGVALGRMTMAQPLIDHGRLVALSTRRLRAESSHYLVYPPRSERHPALVAFRTWVLSEAAAYAKVTASPPGPRQRRREAAKPTPHRKHRSKS